MPKTSDQLRWQLEFGARLRQARRVMGLSQQELAHASGLDRTYVGSVERGRRNVSLIAIWQLAEALMVTPAAFFPAEAPER